MLTVHHLGISQSDRIAERAAYRRAMAAADPDFMPPLE
jgi:hypothetical protein